MVNMFCKLSNYLSKSLGYAVNQFHIMFVCEKNRIGRCTNSTLLYTAYLLNTVWPVGKLTCEINLVTWPKFMGYFT